MPLIMTTIIISNAKIFKSGLANSNGNNKRRFYELILA